VHGQSTRKGVKRECKLNIDKAGLDKALSQIQNYAWLFEWGMFIFLMVRPGGHGVVIIDRRRAKWR